MAVGRLHLESTWTGVFFKSCGPVGQSAGVAEVVKGAGLKIRSRMGSWVRIPPPALLSPMHFPLVEGALPEQTMQNRLTVG